MPKWINLIGDESLTLDSIRNIEHYGSISRHEVPEMGERHCVVYSEKDCIFYDFANIIDEYEPDDLKKIPFKKPNFIMMIYRSTDRVMPILRQDNFLRGIYVDNNYDSIMPIEEFIVSGVVHN